tara:strand:- start:738 stop:2216 length:1479 start_codon:yes stop_codon:yes gene_type:complete
MINNKVITLLKNYFEEKKKNLISLLGDSNLSNHLKVIKIGKENSPLELSKTKLKVRGTIDANDISINGIAVTTDGATQLDELSDVAYSSGDLNISSLDTIKATDMSTGASDGSDLQVEAQNGVGTNFAGGDLILEAGRQTGNHATSKVIVKTGVLSGSTGTTVRNSANIAEFSENGLSVFNTDGTSIGQIKLRILGDAGIYNKILGTGMETIGDMTLDGGGGNINFDDDGHTFARLTKSDSSFTLFETGVDASVDIFKITCGTSGATTISTNDGFTAGGALTIDPDGFLKLKSAGITPFIFIENNFKIKEVADAGNDSADYGQLWVHDTDPNELCFTDGAGTDIVGIGKYQYETKFIGYYATAALIYFPMTGYTIERTALTNFNENNAFTAPFNGTIQKICFRSEIAQSGGSRLVMWDSSDGTEVPGTLVFRKDETLSLADDTYHEMDLTSPTVGTEYMPMTKGKIYAIELTTPAATYDTNITVVFKWDITS